MGHMAEARVLNPNISATTEAFGGHMAEARVLNPDISATTEAFGAYKVSATTQSSGLDDGAAPASLCATPVLQLRASTEREEEGGERSVEDAGPTIRGAAGTSAASTTDSSSTRHRSQVGGVQAATAEEDKRHKAEELNRQLRGLIAQHLSTAGTFKNLLTQNSDLAERAQSVLSNRHSCAPSAPLATFPTLGAIASR
ncbi:hypothetical protein PF010_g12061 [Phytophthora fragariae]|uniref:Uncharacterized protein n=1 Tax=Phytophthora fragariae TaxID=53985 RepID=A0A6A3TXF3_9STRA|nr:hypothetical protein PF010_g12061 [Phytophthora fragariae]KAE9143305.1 hypothetical protein PF006_g11646 [Phytophthora fragariae]